MTALLVLAASVATARADESALGEMAGNINQLVEPARHTELRLDAGAVALLPRGGDRFDVALEIADNDDLNVLGMNYLSSLSRWGVEGRWLILVS